MLATGLGTCGLFLVVAGQAETFWQLYVLLVPRRSGRRKRERRHRAGGDGLVRRLGNVASRSGSGRRRFLSAGSWVRSCCRSSPCTTRTRSWVAFAARRDRWSDLPPRAECAPVEVADVEWTLRDHRLWRLCAVAGLYVVAQMAILGFVALYLHDERSLSKGQAAAVLGAVQVAAMVMRVGAGQWSDKLRTRIVPLARIGIAMSVALAVVTVLAGRAAALARPGLRRRRVADDGLERRCLRRRRRAGGPSAKRVGARRPADGALARRRRNAACLRGRRLLRLLEPRLRAGGVVPDCRAGSCCGRFRPRVRRGSA